MTCHLQWIFFTSLDSCSEVCAALETCGGACGRFMWEDCYPTPFWTRSLGRHNDHLPERGHEILAEPSEFARG